MEIVLQRDVLHDDYTLGTMYVGLRHYGYTCEDRDRLLELHPEAKIHGKTCIPRGRYRVTSSPSKRFGRVMLELLEVPGFSGVRIHGGNTSADTEGCPLLGSVRTLDGVANCKERCESLLRDVQSAEQRGEEVWIDVK